ncbi:uncharacterized protein TRIADDRAFT_53926 [Trichoplax adhaerens]|uniref:Uncharacterized protein n=1 Tax=Trichoplax adhaerens TaxID=10228 RepID=B3RME6_TRIAD|nr:hypothetical protein TRIADDRAFT_53926 [Trichoplax adhaerens]EDV27836.1 hypothetical protein TRIADDRAFT_53926 [Trichoplax adhaerens]|eukprot:XP_002109670.1 hypothetical protein TRIADDRAFT_53926 [Trichoplax adhaerens]
MMIQPLPNGSEETGDISLKVVRKNDDKISEKAEENDYDSSEVSFDPNYIKFIATPLKKSRSTLKRAATRNNLNIEISPVYKACQAGDLRNLKTFVRQADIKSKELSADLVNVVDESLFTPLHYAAIHNHADILAFLLSKGADIDAVGGCLSRTPLHMAVENNSLQSIRELISRDADMFITDEHNQHVVHIAAMQGNTETTKLILENLQQYSSTLINDVDDENMTALHHAADRCHYGVCQLLIEHGAKLAVVANEGSTCLHLAAYRLDLGIMELLLRTAENQGIKQFINMGDSDGKTVLEIAVELNHFEMTQLCLTYGADPAGDPIKSGDGPHQSRSKSLLHIVAINGHIEIAKLLVQYGVCLESADDKGRTAMHFAALGNHPHVIRYLHKQGLHIDIMDKNKVTPFLTALQRGYINMIRTLLNLGANIMHADINNRNCLHYAVNHQDISPLQLLFDRGAVSAINDKDRNGDTPLLVCIPNRNEQVSA